MEDLSKVEFEMEFLRTLLDCEEVVVPLVPAESYSESIDITREFALDIIARYSFERVGDNVSVGSVRYTEADGHHYWVRLMSARIS